MKIAVIGAGFSGLALSWHLAGLKKDIEISIFDPLPIGEGTSGNSTGLLHPFLGKYLSKTMYAEEGMLSSRELLSVAQKHSEEPVAFYHGVFRAALTKNHEKIYRKRARKYPEIVFWSGKEAEEKLLSHITYPGIYIPEGITVHPKRYLQGLFKALQKKGVKFIQKKVTHSMLQGQDYCFFTTGSCVEFMEQKLPFPYQKIKGQMLVCKWPDSIEKLPMSVCADGHVSIVENYCYLGSTYEYNFLEEKVDGLADLLMEKIGRFFPLVKKMPIIEKRSGIRMKRKDSYLPIIYRIDEKSWFFSALGSRGLIYHSMFAKRLVDMLFPNVKRNIF